MLFHILHLYRCIEAAQLADTAGMEPIAYEFFERAMTIYEDEISDSQVGGLYKLNAVVTRSLKAPGFNP
jgi:hypothetical protein